MCDESKGVIVISDAQLVLSSHFPRNIYDIEWDLSVEVGSYIYTLEQVQWYYFSQQLGTSFPGVIQASKPFQLMEGSHWIMSTV